MYNEKTAELQKMLRSIEDDNGGSSDVYMNGVYDEPSRAAVIAFQKSKGLVPNGTVDNATWNAIVREYSDIAEKRNPPMRIAFFTNTDGYSVGIGDSGELVRVLQIILNELRRLYDGYSHLNVDGYYGVNTEDAVRVVQKANRLNSDGRVNKATWNRLATEYNSLENSSNV